jgi:hypothetical protein
MPDRYWDADIVFTRVGLYVDDIREHGEKFILGLTRDQFMNLAKIKITSARDKLRDYTLYGGIQQNDDGVYTLTERGKALLSDGPQRSAAIEVAVNQSPLWRNLISTIGKNPSKESFDRAIKSIPSLANINAGSLANLWYAFTADVACITKKNPPFASGRRSTLTRFAVIASVAPDTRVEKNFSPMPERPPLTENSTPQTACEPCTSSMPENENPFELVIQFEGDKVYHITNEHWRSLARSLLTELEKKVL